MKVLKFGGSSLGTPERIRKVKEIIRQNNLPCIVVVSAFEGVTDHLSRIAESASAGKEEYTEDLEKLISSQREFACNLLTSEDDLDMAQKHIDNIFNELGETLRGFFLLRESTGHALEQILASGERISSFIISLYLEDSLYIDSRELIKTEGKPGNTIVDFPLTNSLIRAALENSDKLVVLPGYISSNHQGDTTT
ncbi:MAG: bifunctional aspartate kinase/homoserine dehydrogenase I, partial [Bacteroidales bacterium]|nr:bifunctional aspartate kinase/homoserine dehydrogenase I [Bacteroidales bacterium]